MSDRVGSCYLIDHGAGRQSLRLVVGGSTAGWVVVAVRDEGATEMEYNETSLLAWDAIALTGEGNVRRLTW